MCHRLPLEGRMEKGIKKIKSWDGVAYTLLSFVSDLCLVLIRQLTIRHDMILGTPAGHRRRDLGPTGTAGGPTASRSGALVED